MFNENGPLKVRNPAYYNNAYIGQVDANNVPPPHIVLSLVQHICANEGKRSGITQADLDNGDTFSTELFRTISNPKAYDLRDPLSLLNPDRPGSRPNEPLVLKIVYQAC